MEIAIYKDDSGFLAVLAPNLDCGLTIQEIAKKDVPKGKPYRIIDASELPTDNRQRDAWTVDDADLTDGVGGVA